MRQLCLRELTGQGQPQHAHQAQQQPPLLPPVARTNAGSVFSGRFVCSYVGCLKIECCRVPGQLCLNADRTLAPAAAEVRRQPPLFAGSAFLLYFENLREILH